MRVPQPELGALPDPELNREIGLMSDFELQKALNQPSAYAVGPREERAINGELGWRHHERVAAAEAHHDRFRSAGFDDGFSVDISRGIPDPIADPLPDPVVNHVDAVTAGDFRPEPLPGNEPVPETVVTPDTSPLDVVPYKDPDDVSISRNYANDGINVRFEVSFESDFESDFESEFDSEFDSTFDS
jgi:hypothetical protein